MRFQLPTTLIMAAPDSYLARQKKRLQPTRSTPSKSRCRNISYRSNDGLLRISTKKGTSCRFSVQAEEKDVGWVEFNGRGRGRVM